MKFYIWYLSTFLFLLNGTSCLFAQQPIAAGKSKFLGAGTNSSIWSKFQQYWNQVTPGNDGKWGSVEYTQGQYSFKNLDTIYNFALRNNIPFKEHTLLWGQQQPSWISSLDSAAQRAAIERWIDTLAKRYPLTAYVDVVNEPFNAPPPYKNALGGDGTTGWDWVITAFQLARRAYPPTTKLLINEYNVLHSNSVTTKYLTIINLLKERGLLDGIGIQGHYFEFRSDIGSSPSYVYDIQTIKNNLNRLVETGIPVYITEFDIDEGIDSNQVNQYKIYFPIFWNHPGVKGITLWGYHYNDVWSAHPNTYLIDSRGKERPALTWLRSYCSLPFTPVIVSPLNGTKNVPRNTKLIWNAAESAQSYRVQLSSASYFPSALILMDTVVTDTVLFLPLLTANTLYYWRVCAVNKNGASEYSSPAGFTTGASTVIDTVHVASDTRMGTTGNLNRAIHAVRSKGLLSYTVFLLELNGSYILDSTITLPEGEHVTIVAPSPGMSQETSPPQVLWSSASNVAQNYIFRCYGDLTLKNLWIFNATTNGDQTSSCVIFEKSSQPNARRCTLENVILDFFGCPYVAGGAITVNCTHFRGQFKNCYWKNCVDSHLRYYGRAVSFPYQGTGLSIDSLIFENCTFANIGYVLMVEEGNPVDVVKFNHCTFSNVVMFPLESGWWYKLVVANCIFANCWMLGWIPGNTWKDPLTGVYEPYGAVFRIDSVASFGFTPWWAEGRSDPEQERRIIIRNCSYSLDRWLVEWMLAENYYVKNYWYYYKEYLPLPQPMLSPKTIFFLNATDNEGRKLFPKIVMENLYNGIEDSLVTYPWPWGDTLITYVPGQVDRLIKYDIYNPHFTLPATDTFKLKAFIMRKWFDCCDTLWAWKLENSINRVWPLEENFSYTNSILRSAGMGGYPLGDLYHWWQDIYPSWEAQAESENAELDQFLVNVPTRGLPVNASDFIVYQNYPNPFNPVTTISYRIPTLSHVTVRIIDLIGRTVATLVDEVQQAKTYTIQWDGSSMSSGVYFCRIDVQCVSSSKSSTAVKKLLLLK